MSPAEDLKQVAREAGADLVGIAPARPGPEASFLSEWLRAGRHAGLDFMGRDAAVRQDIRRWYPEARCVLVCGFGYGRGQAAPPRPGAGLLARYAAREDYHRALKPRMEAVLERFRRHRPQADGRVFVDTSPVSERLYGYYAGLGWIGRNCLLISENLGSFFLIAGIALNLELDPDRPAPERCGSCRLCQDACPSGALRRERALDAGLCAAYLTIEHRGPIPAKQRAGVGCWVAGCDLCQEACPWNRSSGVEGILKRLLPSEIPLDELAGLDAAGFEARFAATPLARLKPRGLLRNALLAMGNSRETRFRPVLERFCVDPDPVLREQARWSLSRLPARGLIL